MTSTVFRLWKLFREDLLLPIQEMGRGATGMLMVIKQAHSFCTELKETAKVIHIKLII